MNYETRWLGTVEYSLATQLQKNLSETIRHGTSGVILGLEHPEVITLGLRGSDADILSASGTPVLRSDRGGQATYHNPGQLVIYPVCPVKNWRWGARNWVETLTNITSLVLEKCNIIVVSQNNGIYTEFGKISSVGFNLKGGVSTHGIAINVSNDLAGFSKISACGVQKQSMDRVARAHKITPEALFSLWCDEFRAVFPVKRDEVLTSPALQI